MNRLRNIQFAGAIAGAMCFAARVQAANQPEGNWSFEVSPYLWVADVGIETSLAGSPSGPGVERFETRLTAGAMLTAAARYRSVGVFVDFAWARLRTEAVNPGPAFSALELQSDFIHTTAALTYALPLAGKLHAELLAGARVWYVTEDFSATGGLLPGFSAGTDTTWADPIIGGSVSYEFSKRWSTVVKGTVGGFGVSADFAGEVFAGFNYRINDWCSAALGYRYLHEDYDRGGFNFDLQAHGFLLGFGFRF